VRIEPVAVFPKFWVNEVPEHERAARVAVSQYDGRPGVRRGPASRVEKFGIHPIRRQSRYGLVDRIRNFQAPYVHETPRMGRAVATIYGCASPPLTVPNPWEWRLVGTQPQWPTRRFAAPWGAVPPTGESGRDLPGTVVCQ